MWVEETKNGNYKFVEQYKDYMTGKKKRVSVTMSKNTAATRRAALDELNRKIESSQKATVDSEDITLKYLIDKYRLQQEKTVKKSTYTRNYHACKTLMSILGEDTLVNRLTAPYIKEKFLATNKSHGTLNEHRARLKALLNWGFENDYIEDVSFLAKFKPFNDIPHKQKIQDKYLESEDAKKLLKYIESTNCWHWQYLTNFLILSGLRFGEAAALTIDDIDFKNSLIHVSKNYDVLNKVVTTPKTLCSIRDVFMQPDLFKLCKKISAFEKEQKLLYGYQDDKMLFFKNNKGDYISYYAFEKFLRTASLKILNHKITSHALRHTHASLLLEQGVSIDTISRRLGHENSVITREIYLHVTKKLEKKDNDQISAIKII